LPSNLEKYSNSDLNFQACNDAYIDLYDTDKFCAVVKNVCEIIEEYLQNIEA